MLFSDHALTSSGRAGQGKSTTFLKGQLQILRVVSSIYYDECSLSFATLFNLY